MTFSPKLAGSFVIMLGVFVLMYVIVYFFAKRAAAKRYGRAEATVDKIKLIPKNGEPDKKLKCPVISFKAGEEEIKTMYYDGVCDEDKECRFGEGDSLTVAYEKKRPDRVFPESDLRLKKVQMIISSVIAVILIVAGAVLRNVDLYK